VISMKKQYKTISSIVFIIIAIMCLTVGVYKNIGNLTLLSIYILTGGYMFLSGLFLICSLAHKNKNKQEK
jgi:uncharacterized membrane protein